MMNTWMDLDEIKDDKSIVGFLVRVEGMHVDCEPDTSDVEFYYERGYWKQIYYETTDLVGFAVVSSEEDVDSLEGFMHKETNEREIVAELYVNEKGVRMARLISEDAKEILAA